MEKALPLYEIDYFAVRGKRSACIIALSLIWFDYFLTLPREINWIWSSTRKRISPVHVIFYLNRYVPLLGQFVIAYRYFINPTRTSPIVCLRLVSFKLFLSYAVHLTSASFSIIRVYGLYNKDRRVLAAMVFALSFGLAGAIALLILGRLNTPIDLQLKVDNCLRNIPNKRAHQYALQYMALLFFDVLIFGLTLRKSLQHSRRVQTPLVSIVLRDGTMAFGAMSLTCVAVIISFFLSSPVGRGREVVVATSISSILVSRMILNLRNPALTSGHPYSDSRETQSLQNIGDFTTIIDTNHDMEDDMLDSDVVYASRRFDSLSAGHGNGKSDYATELELRDTIPLSKVVSSRRYP